MCLARDMAFLQLVRIYICMCATRPSITAHFTFLCYAFFNFCMFTPRSYSMGGMFSWSLGQDPRTAPLIAGMGTVMGLPLHDYLVGKGTASDIPVIGIYGDRDCSVPPGDGSDVYNESCNNNNGYLYVDAFHQHRLWASDHGCSVGMTHPAQYEYSIPGRDEINCASHCNPADGVPFSVDCRNDAEHGKEPWHLDAVLKFFEDHYNSRTN